ncbi:MAG: nucleotidyl transferase AbiEii/AbiGii toxin family protein [Gammaproteobacteria bacterium]
MDPKAVEALRILSRVLSQEGRRFVLIGATVPQIVLDFRGSPGSRETRDVDAVAEVHGWDDFARIRKRLEEAGFRQGRVAHELWHNDEVRIDLIPFGPGLVEEDKLSWPYGDSIMTACGLEEALECAQDQEVAPNLKLPVVTIPGLVLTKVVAYMDRPEERARDLIDIFYCFEHYEAAVGQSRRFDHAGAEVDDKPVTFEEAGALLLGLEVAALAKPKSLEICQPFSRLDPGRFCEGHFPDPDGRKTLHR